MQAHQHTGRRYSRQRVHSASRHVCLYVMCVFVRERACECAHACFKTLHMEPELGDSLVLPGSLHPGWAIVPLTPPSSTHENTHFLPFTGLSLTRILLISHHPIIFFTPPVTVNPSAFGSCYFLFDYCDFNVGFLIFFHGKAQVDVLF